MAKALTDKAIEKLKPGSSRKELPDPALGGLYLIVQPTGSKGWALRYRSGGRPRKLTIGKYPAIGLADARKLASEALQKVELGRDPAHEKRVPRATDNSVATALALYAERHLSTLKSGGTVKRELDRFAGEAWRGRDIRSIKRRDVVALLDDVVASGRAVTANRLKSYLGHFFGWCLSRDLIEHSPMEGVKRPARETSRDRVLSDDEIRLFWLACDQVSRPWGTMGKMLLLTGQRLGEVAGMTEAELAGDEWRLPKARTKNGRAHSVPVVDAVADILTAHERVDNPEGYIFTTNGRTAVSGFHKARQSIADAMEAIAKGEGHGAEIPHWTFHDLRRTLATGMQRLGVRVEVTEALLNHASGSRGGVVGVYQRHDYADEKRAALAAWARHVAAMVAGSNEATNVVRMDERA